MSLELIVICILGIAFAWEHHQHLKDMDDNFRIGYQRGFDDGKSAQSWQSLKDRNGIR
jgi:hypothetical protein